MRYWWILKTLSFVAPEHMKCRHVHSS